MTELTELKLAADDSVAYEEDSNVCGNGIEAEELQEEQEEAMVVEPN
jgi:hypothetical protein